ncbi:MAG: SEC-C metal-binding domain-containing protein [Pseudomonadota bacterium]|nr:SEC-C metal-binding domain-containing protein [Pseudomonadota bacterium]MEC8621181.1 SEC-C metal-binding domain-containing protein [Pseudomonadota bacterium]
MVQKSATSAPNVEEQDCCNEPSCCAPQVPFTRAVPKVGRNDPCPCGNGKKFKKCCGRSE